MDEHQEAPVQDDSPQETQNTTDWRRVIIFCLIAFAFSGSAALYIALQGGLAAMAGIQGVLILALWYMTGPAVANLLTRVLTNEGWQNLWLRPRIRQGWPAWIVAWLLPALLVISGAAIFFLIFPEYFDPTYAPVRAIIESASAAGATLPFSAEMLIVLQVAQAVVLAPILNALPTLGEEFGWRAYLQPKLMTLGFRRAVVLTGIVWGLWHWPLLALGYNYGFAYAGAPWLGMLAFVWFTINMGIILGWLTVRGQSVWPAVIGHGALNGIAALPMLFVQGEPNLLLGPFVQGLIAGIPTFLVAAWLLWRPPQERA